MTGEEHLVEHDGVEAMELRLQLVAVRSRGELQQLRRVRKLA